MGDDPAFQDFDRIALSHTCNFTIEEVQENLRDQIERAGIFLRYNGIYIIAHSMGGLIVKRMLATLNTPAEVDKLRRIKAALFLSTPTQGAPLAVVGSLFRWCNTQLSDLRTADGRNSFLQAVENDWARLWRARGFEAFPLAYGAYESNSILGFDVVTRIYAASQYDRNLSALDEDHVSIVKPETINAPSYQWVKARIQEAATRARAYPELLSKYLAAKDPERLTRDYPLGWAVFNSSGGAKPQYTVHPTTAVTIHAGSVRSFLVAPGRLIVRLPAFTIAPEGGSFYSNVVAINFKSRPSLVIELDKTQGWVEPLFYDDNNFVWVWGFRPARSK
jgi:pimeloyl-ACP methyl ester carboxylesterase